MNETSSYRTLVFFMRNDEVLLAMKKRGFGAGKYNGVGGKLELGEGAEEAMVREAQEEVGVAPINYWPVAQLNFEEYEDGQLQHMYVYVYFCDQWEGEPTESEEMSPKWYPKSTLPFNEMWLDDPYWLPATLNGKLIKGRFVFDRNDQLLVHETDEVPSLDFSAITA